MMLLLIGLILAYWFKQEWAKFPLRINKQIYEDYQQLLHTDITFDEFLSKSPLQVKACRRFYLFYLLFPFVLWIFKTLPLPLIFISLILLYLSLLDSVYYLTDIRYVALIFMLSIAQLLFYDQTVLYLHLLNLLLTSLFFTIFIPLTNRLFNQEMLGIGDVVLLVALTPLFIIEQMMLLLLYSSLCGLFFALCYKLICRKNIHRLPFIPFITISTFILFIDRIPAVFNI
ncbi:peptidase [Glaesserella sp.]|uniref:peptidase n=1 Tax=Glaesserella sp. TaxID=2094731 RepID=UPI0035A15985